MTNKKRIGKNKRLPKILFLYMAIFFIGFAYVIGHTIYIDIRADEYIALALKQWTSDRVIDPKRGKIVDRNGVVLARSSPARNVIVEPKQIESEVERRRVADTLGSVLEMDSNAIYEKITTTKQEQITIRRQITEDQYTLLLREYLRGVVFQEERRRYYAQNDMAAQLIGLTNMNGEGQSGIEREYNEELSGQPGRSITESDRLGLQTSLDSQQNVPAQDGANVILTIDIAIQASMEEALIELMRVSSAKQAQSILVDIKSGEVLAEANLPSLNLNDPPRNDTNELMKLLYDDCISSIYEPHNLMQPITAAIALDTGAIQTKDMYVCEGKIEIAGVVTECSHKHGTQTLKEVINNECQVAVARIASDIDLNQYYESLGLFHVGESTGIDMQRENFGVLKHKKYVNMGEKGLIGNGLYEKVTSLQLASMYATIANEGQAMKMRVVSGIQAQDGTLMVDNKAETTGTTVSPETAKTVLEILQNKSSQSNQSTYQLSNYDIMAITDYAEQKNNDITSIRTTNIALAPENNPRFVLITSLIDAEVGGKRYAHAAFGPTARTILGDAMLHQNIVLDTSDVQSNNQEILVPELKGMLLHDATQALKDVGLEPAANGTGVVREQSPAAGTSVPKTSGVVLYMTGVAEGEQEQTQEEDIDYVRVPDVIGQSAEGALQKLFQASLEVEIEGDPMTKVITQYPYAGKRVPKGTSVTISMTPLSFVPGEEPVSTLASDEIDESVE